MIGIGTRKLNISVQTIFIQSQFYQVSYFEYNFVNTNKVRNLYVYELENIQFYVVQNF